MSSLSNLSRRDAVRTIGTSVHTASAAAQERAQAPRSDFAQVRRAAKAGSTGGSSLLCGLPRPTFGNAPAPMQSEELPATPAQRSALAEGLHQDRTEGATAQRHGDTQMSGQFARDAVRSSLFLVKRDESWRTGEDIRPSRPTELGDTAHKLIAFCDGDKDWAFRVSQYANQNLANRSWAVGLIGGQGLDGRVYKGRKILRCSTVQNDSVSPQHERLELRRLSDSTMRLTWSRTRDVSSLHLAGRDKPKKLGKGSGYAVTVAVDLDRPQPGETTPVRLAEANLRVRLPRPLDA